MKKGKIYHVENNVSIQTPHEIAKLVRILQKKNIAIPDNFAEVVATSDKTDVASILKFLKSGKEEKMGKDEKPKPKKKNGVLDKVWKMYYDGETDKEKIAKQCGASENTVNTEGNYYRRALKFFKEHSVSQAASGKK